jgi:hypothetical protein
MINFKRFVESSAFFILVLFLTRQFPLNEYSLIMNVALLVLVVSLLSDFLENLIVKRITSGTKMILFSLITLLLLSVYSLVRGNEVENIFRFFIIISSLLLAYSTNPRNDYIKYFLFFIFIQAVVIDVVFLYLKFSFTLESYSVVRTFFNVNNWGDVYSFDGDFWYVKIVGSGLLPVGFFVGYLYLSGLVRKVFLITIIPSMIVSNLAFILASILFVISIFWVESKATYKKYISALMLFIFLFVSFAYLSYQNDYVFDSTSLHKESSLSTRSDQLDVLVSDLTKSPLDILVGNGLGHTLKVNTSARDYTGNVYFEMMPLYLLNQLGIIFFSLLVLINLFLTKEFINNTKLYLVYFSYLIYASTNPYIFDTSHFVVIVILVSLKKVLDEKNLRHSSYL